MEPIVGPTTASRPRTSFRLPRTLMQARRAVPSFSRSRFTGAMSTEHREHTRDAVPRRCKTCPRGAKTRESQVGGGCVVVHRNVMGVGTCNVHSSVQRQGRHSWARRPTAHNALAAERRGGEESVSRSGVQHRTCSLTPRLGDAMPPMTTSLERKARSAPAVRPGIRVELLATVDRVRPGRASKSRAAACSPSPHHNNPTLR